MKRLSIIIVTYNSEKDIYDCIGSIMTYSDIPLSELELIIVDNNSHDTDTMFAKLKEQYGEDIILIRNTHNGGYGQGNNVGIRRATAPVILIMNPDVRLLEPVFKTALNAYEKDSKLTIFGMKQMLTPTIPSTSSFVCTYMMNGYVGTILTALCTRMEWYIPCCMYIHGSCFFIRKSFFEEIGLFNESVFMYGEEDDIRCRLRKIGYKKIIYEHKLHYIHKTKEREPDLDYELKLVNAVIRQNEKHGYPADKIIKNRIRNAKLLLLREFLRIKTGKKDTKLYDMLKKYIFTLKNAHV